MKEDAVKITIIGGSQGTGAQLAALAHTAGHDVTVLSRSGRGENGVRSLAGDASDPVVAAEAVAGADAVVITVGAAKGTHHQRAAVTRAVVAAMESAGVSRLVVQSSLGAGNSASQLPAVFRFITMLLLAKPLADHNEQESAVMNSGLAWTVLRPTGLTNKTPTGKWHAVEVGDATKLGGTVPRGDLAACLLGVLEDDTTIGKALGVSSR